MNKNKHKVSLSVHSIHRGNERVNCKERELKDIAKKAYRIGYTADKLSNFKISHYAYQCLHPRSRRFIVKYYQGKIFIFTSTKKLVTVYMAPKRLQEECNSLIDKCFHKKELDKE